MQRIGVFRIPLEPRQDSGRLSGARSRSLLHFHDRGDCCGCRIGDPGVGAVEGSEQTFRALRIVLLNSVKVIKLHSLWNGTDFSKSFLQPIWPHCLKQYIPSKIFSSFTIQRCVSSIAKQKVLRSKLCTIFVVSENLATITTLISPIILEWSD